MNSKRRYSVAICDNIGLTIEKYALHTIAEVKSENEPEIFYAMRDKIDDILDLQVGESMYFQPNRDDKNSKGIIRREN